MTCQQAVDWYVTLKNEAYCFELQDKFLMREEVDCVRNEEQKKRYCHKNPAGQWIFYDIRDLMFRVVLVESCNIYAVSKDWFESTRLLP